MRNLVAFIVLIMSAITCYGRDMDVQGLGDHLAGRTISDTVKSDWINISDYEIFNLFFDIGNWGDSTKVFVDYWISPDRIAPNDTTTQGYYKMNTLDYTVLDSIVTADSLNDGKFWLSVTGTASLAPGACRNIQFIFIPDADHDSLKLDAEPKIVKYK